ncbi:VOC family protein [Sphingobium chungbukense]|nr:VOC family protein [Sphingobium chungbukense]
MISIVDISHVIFRVPDPDRMTTFLNDFGLIPRMVDDRLYARGLGASPYLHVTEKGEPGFVALGFRAESEAELRAFGLAEGVEPQRLQRPGGGLCVTLRDPDGFLIEVVAGQDLPPALQLPPTDGWNNVRQRERIRKVKRMGNAGANVVRLGHCVLNVSDFRRSEAWYKSRFGFITSDEIAIAGGKGIGAFLRFDRGDEPTDHHSLALVETTDTPGFNHAAFEVVDFDDLYAGHVRLSAGGWEPYWGVGRHLLGSQVFDYWRDPWGNTLEHWTDGDLLTAADGSNIVPVSELMATQWGPPPPFA